MNDRSKPWVAGVLALGLASAAWAQEGPQKLPSIKLNAGAGNDAITVQAFGSPFGLSVDGGAGTNSLSVTGLTQPVNSPTGPTSGTVSATTDYIAYNNIQSISLNKLQKIPFP